LWIDKHAVKEHVLQFFITQPLNYKLTIFLEVKGTVARDFLVSFVYAISIQLRCDFFIFFLKKNTSQKAVLISM